MCGIVSIFNYKSPDAVDRAELRRIRDHMARRGPDGEGEWYSPDNRVGLGHRRLAIIDLSETGAQPMSNEDGTVWIAFNGEIYNYQALRSELSALGHRFRSNSDTEVIIHGYEEWGIEELLKQLRGMFAFALYDSALTPHPSRLIIARDPFGIKPLYYADDGRSIRVASQVKALLAGGKIDTSPEPAGHVGFFLWGHVPEPYTLYKGIRSLPAGSFLVVPALSEPGTFNLEPRTFCSIPEIFAEAERNPAALSREEMGEHLRDALRDTVKHHLIADVPVGVFLSAGIDSGSLVGLASEFSTAQLHTATLAFKEYADTHDDESALSTLVADHYHTRHDTVWVSKKDFQEEADRLLAAMDQPSTDGVNSYFVAEAAVKSGLKVALSGLGGDEIFGSYPSFGQVPRMAGLFGPFAGMPLLGRGFRMVSTPVIRHFTSPKYGGLLEYGGSYGGAYLLRRGMFMPWELPSVLDPEMAREGWRKLDTMARLNDSLGDLKSDYLKVSCLELTWYMRNQLLRDTDWASMAHSLEVRVPLVDVALLKAVAPLLAASGRPDKTDLAHSPSRPLPVQIVRRGKTGFSIPVREWMMGENGAGGERGLRGWAKVVYESATGAVSERRVFVAAGMSASSPAGSPCVDVAAKPFRALALVTDAFGGHGGIALYNRDLLTALCSHPLCAGVVVLPRVIPHPTEEMPGKLDYVRAAASGKRAYIKALLKKVFGVERFDLIVCGHINLLPLAYIAKMVHQAPLVLMIYGIDAWAPPAGRPLVRKLVRKIDAFISISQVTKDRFLSWADVPAEKGYILPNAIHLDKYGPGPKRADLLRRYRIEGKTILLTVGRLVSVERYKGFDEVMEVLPELSRDIPNVVYLIVGDGDDRERLEAKAKALGLKDRVVFAGFVPEEEKADHYRLADVYVMPSRGEGFGFVFLEALACGVPAIGSKVDGSREALRDGALGVLVDPGDRAAISAAVSAAVKVGRAVVPEGLEYFFYSNFAQRLHGIVQATRN